jgi:hypothetical protein
LNNASDAQIFWMIANECTERTNKWGGSETRLKVNVLEKKLGMSSKVLGLMGLKALGNAFMAYEKYSDQAKNLGKHFNSALLGMEKAARIDNRNTAMSSVAKLLGQPNLVAKSVNMKFMDENGNVQEGTFMDVADGIDLAAGGEKMRLVNENPFEGRNSGKGLSRWRICRCWITSAATWTGTRETCSTRSTRTATWWACRASTTTPPSDASPTRGRTSTPCPVPRI